MTVTYHTGNILDSTMPAIGHGVNCKGLMASGIADFLRKTFPEIEPPYIEACKDGSLQPGGFQMVPTHTGRIIFNLASQDNPGADASYVWLEESLTQAFAHISVDGIHGIALPRIGAGIGGLEWSEVKALIERVAEEFPRVEVELWSLEGADD